MSVLPSPSVLNLQRLPWYESANREVRFMAGKSRVSLLSSLGLEGLGRGIGIQSWTRSLTYPDPYLPFITHHRFH